MNYKGLIVWQKAHALTLRTIKASESIKRSYASDIIIRQLLRAITSIGANIAEGYGRNEGKEYVRFLQIAYGSANEADNWLNVLKDAALMQPETADELLETDQEIQKMLATLIKRIKEKGRGLRAQGNK
ncbi:MAG: four helix bundle protein [Dehalococcoidales bacterium]|jgi:four helix bundle protein